LGKQDLFSQKPKISKNLKNKKKKLWAIVREGRQSRMKK